MSKTILPQTFHPNQKQALKAAAFSVAFCPPEPKQNLTQLWSGQASLAIGTLIDFRSACHRWQAAGEVDSREFVAQVEALDSAGLSDWLDSLIALAMDGAR